MRSSLNVLIGDLSVIPCWGVLSCCERCLELDEKLLAPALKGRFSSIIWKLTSWSLPDAAFATPSWRSGNLSPERDKRSNADFLP